MAPASSVPVFVVLLGASNLSLSFPVVARQLTERFSSHSGSSDALGLIALSITKLQDPRSLNLRVHSQVEANRAFDRLFEAFISEYQEKWRRPRDPRIIGVFLEVSGLVELTSVNMYSNQSFLALVQIGDHDLATTLAGRLETVSPPSRTTA